MSCGKELMQSLRKIGCPLENIDPDNLDWYFDDPKLGSFLNEFCERINSGHLSSTNGVTSKENLKTVAVESTLTSESKKYYDLERKMKSLELNLNYKKNYAALLKMKLQLLKNQKEKEDLALAVLEDAACKNSAKAASLRMSIQPRIKQLADLLKMLMKANDKLLAAVLEQQGLDQPVKVGKAADAVLNRSSQAGVYDSYLHKEKALYDALDHFATSKLQLQQCLNVKTSVVQEWWKEQLRLEKSFFLTAKDYNQSRAAESSLKQEIDFLKKLLEKEHFEEDLSEIEKLRETDRSLSLSLEDVVERNIKDCKEISSKSISYLLIASNRIKLERLEHFKSKQEKLLELLRAEQYRFSFLQFVQKLEAERQRELLAVSQDICRLLRKHQNASLTWISALTSVKGKQKETVSEVVPSCDQVMETVAQVLGSDQNELCHTFPSIVEAAEKLNKKLSLQESTVQENKENIWEQLENLHIICDVLNLVQVPLDKNTQYHGDHNLCQAMLKLKKYMKLYTSSVADYEKQLKEYKKMLENCPREVFERNQKKKAILQKVVLP